MYTNGIISDPFRLERGTKQGCPLSPSLFAIVIEPLAESIRQDQTIKGISIGKREYKLGLFADDLILYLTDYKNTLPRVLNTLAKYSVVSG